MLSNSTMHMANKKYRGKEIFEKAAYAAKKGY